MGGKKSTTTQNVSIPQEVLDRYNAVNARAEITAQNPFQKFGTNASDFVAQINQQQTAGINSVNEAAGSYKPYMAAGAGATMAGMGPASEGIDRYMSPYIRNVADTTGALMRQQQEQAQSGALGTAISSGAFGGDRAGIAAANLQQQNELGYGKTMADIYNTGYTQALGASQSDLARQMAGGAQLAGIGAQTQAAGLQGAEAQIAAGGLQQQTEQAGKTALVNQFMQEQGYPFQVAQFLANIAMGTGALSGSTTKTTQPASFFASGGRVHKEGGGGVAGPYGASVGSQPFLEGYIPQAYLPVGELMMADSALADQSAQSNADYINQMLQMGQSIRGLMPAEKAYGGGVDAPNTARSYLSDVIDSQKKEDKPELRTSSSPTGESKGGLGETLGNVAKILSFFKDGGVVGRHGYAEGGGSAALSPEEMELFRRRQAIMRDPSLDMPNTGTDTYRPSGSAVQQVYGTEAPPPQLRPNAGLTGLGGLGGGARTEAALPATPQTTGESLSEFLHPLRQSVKATGVSGLGAVSGSLIGGASVVPSAVGAGLSALGAENYGGNYLLDTGSTMRGVAGDIYENSAKQATEIENTPWRSSVTSLPAQSTGVAAPAPSLSATGSITGGLQPPVAGGAGTFAPSTSTPVAGAAVAQDAMSTLGTKASGDVPPVTAANPLEDLSVVFDTKVVSQESGDNQYDRNGSPLTSPKGAVGAAQVMEATGPEAARLAGVEWDRNRWLHDKEYNKQIGKAYFLEQYRRFGSIDKAAAAYNAGPTALAQAIDRATALGGSYLDYLPAETQNYVRNVAGVGAGVAGPAGEAPQAGGGLSGADMSAPTTGGKAYGDRNALGKLMYDPNTNKLSQDAILSILSGIGTMASSPSRFLGSAILQGVGGAANTMAKLQKQAADVGLTKAQTGQASVAADVSRFFTIGPNGMPMVVIGPNRAVTLSEYLANPQSFSTGDPQRDAAILNAARAKSGETGNTAPYQPADASAPEGVRWTATSDDAIERARDMAAKRPDLYPVWQQQIADAIPQFSQARSEAISGKPNVNELAYTVGGAIYEGNMGSVTGYMADNVVAPLNAALRTMGAPEISNADDQSVILRKLSALNGAALTPEQERAASVFQMFANVSPDLKMTPPAAAAISASIMLQNQQAIDQANYYNAFLSKLPMGAPMSEVDAAYAQEYSQRQQQEKTNLTNLFEMAADPVKGATVKKFLGDVNAGMVSQDDAQAILSYILGQDVSPILARYFIKGM